jgi:hypothetical protein
VVWEKMVETVPKERAKEIDGDKKSKAGRLAP